MHFLITVFTPAYNRGYTIGKLYESLCRQSFRDFEWLVVDDGSTDDTGTLLAAFIAENKIPIRYFRQENGGKHRAINRGVCEARSELFFIVDSDDHLADDALERVAFHYGNVRDDAAFAGVSGVCAAESGEKIGGEEAWQILDCNCLDFRYKYGAKGDMAEVFRTSVMREFPFPEIPGERFCPESLVWNRMAQKYKLRYFYEKIYVCEYLPDGLTASIVRQRRRSPETSMLYYSEFSRIALLPFPQKLKGMINFWRFAFLSKRSFLSKLKQGGLFSLVGFLPGFLMFLRDDRSTERVNCSK